MGFRGIYEGTSQGPGGEEQQILQLIEKES